MGSTATLTFTVNIQGDHPHIHGEHTGLDFMYTVAKGSPPYTWGAPDNRSRAILVLRITPIYMGSTLKDPCNQAIFKSSKTLFQSVWS